MNNQPAGSCLAPVSPGELLDKISILEIKAEQMTDPAKLAHVETELSYLEQVRDQAIDRMPEIEALTKRLKAINAKLWCIEDDIRDCEHRQDFGPRFIRLARSVYFTNDERSQVKRQINERLAAELVEEKQYASYGASHTGERAGSQLVAAGNGSRTDWS